MKKAIEFNDDVFSVLQRYADKYLNGNVTATVNLLCAKGLDGVNLDSLATPPPEPKPEA